jgi:PAS domain S-box-containing protein
LAVGLATFAVFGDNDPVKGPIPHAALNWLDAIVALVLFILLYSKRFTKYYIQFGYVFIYLINIQNIFLLYGTSFNEQYAYQFIVVYLISGWFFRHESMYYLHAAIVNLLMLIASVVSEHTTQSTFDFYATYFICTVAQAVLIRYRFGIEDKLHESEKKYRLLAENSRDIICLHDKDGTITYISPAVETILGYSAEKMIGQKPCEIIHPDDKPFIASLNLNEPEHHPVQYRVIDQSGQYHWIETIFKPFKESPSGIEKILTQSRDIRRSKSYQTQLEERKRELERSNADLETFAFVSSHDMKEPLRMISNYMQLLKRRYGDKLDKEANEYIDYANRGAVTLQQLIQDLLSYSRITRTEIKKENISLAKVAKEAIGNIDLMLKEKNAVVKIEGDCQVLSDASLLVLVLQNLIENGVKYNHSPTPTIELSCSKEENWVIVAVKDNGEGIAPHHQQRIFEPFHRLHTKAEIPGTGLGLSICKRIIERLGGKLWLQSETGKGTTFYFSLPA